jgi:DNA-binding response OmpR family regulator
MTSVSRGEEAGRTILVVDDEPGILDFVRRVLHCANYNVVTSRSGDHAWRLIEQGRPKLDLVLTDIVMPGSMDGFALAGSIRRKRSNLPVLFMAGALPESDEYEMEMARKRLLLRKPFPPSQLVEFIDWQFGGSGDGIEGISRQ